MNSQVRNGTAITDTSLVDLCAFMNAASISNIPTLLSAQSAGALVKAMTTSAPVQPMAVPDGAVIKAAQALLDEHKAACLSDPMNALIEMADDDEEASVSAALLADLFRALNAAPAAQGDATQAAIDVLAERCRQVDGEGWTVAQDDNYTAGQLAKAAASYCLYQTSSAPGCWPWNRDYWKPKGYRANMVRAGALILAEIERLDRAAIAAKAAS